MTEKLHFDPLNEHIEETGQDLAIGYMVIFFNLVEDTSRGQLSSDITVIGRGLKTLS